MTIPVFKILPSVTNIWLILEFQYFIELCVLNLTNLNYISNAATRKKILKIILIKYLKI